MSDATKRPPSLPSPERISLVEPFELHAWTRTFSCTAQELREAVAAVGDRVVDVRDHLAARRAGWASS